MPGTVDINESGGGISAESQGDVTQAKKAIAVARVRHEALRADNSS